MTAIKTPADVSLDPLPIPTSLLEGSGTLAKIFTGSLQTFAVSTVGTWAGVKADGRGILSV